MIKHIRSARTKDGPYIVGYVGAINSNFIHFDCFNNYIVACKFAKKYNMEVRYIPNPDNPYHYKHANDLAYPKGKAGWCDGLSRKSIKELLRPFLKKK